MKGIMFTEPLFHKVIEGVKTQTRRVIDPQPIDSRNWQIGLMVDSTSKDDKKSIGNNHYLLLENEYTIKESDNRYFLPKYRVDEIVYLKEPYVDDLIMEKTLYKYNKSDLQELIDNGCGDMINAKGFWRNKLFMPKSAARYFIKITSVRAELLQDICEEDCFKEGIEDSDCGGMKCVVFGVRSGLFFKELGSTPQDAYATLIDRIAGRGTWDKNPWVFVYDFELYNCK